ncbi:MAG: hypothetical protein FH761_19110 [Firmicutes bacterium]|nr:hypothetical protein [Bacillota bacterium]
MKRFILLIVVLFSLLGAVGCMNKNEISESEIENRTYIRTQVTTEDKPKENSNVDINSGSQSESKNKNDNDIQSISSFIPTGWHVLQKSDGKLAMAEGDLNKDDITDKVFVIEKSDQLEYEHPRNLLIAFGNKDNTYTLSIKVEKAILLRNEGGAFGDPFQDMIIDRGSILLKFYGGSSSKWFMDYRFRYQDEGWFLIGATLGGSFTGIDGNVYVDEEDYNLLTGDYIIRKYDENGKLTISKGNRGKRQLLNLRNFDAAADNKSKI